MIYRFLKSYLLIFQQEVYLTILIYISQTVIPVTFILSNCFTFQDAIKVIDI